MAIPPLGPTPEASRPWFRRLRELRDGLFGRAAWSGGPGWLSMGMSGDFEVAIEEGATHVRIGTALFGFALLQLLFALLNGYMWVIIIRALLSWVSPDPYNPIVRVLVQITEPVLRPLRRLLPPARTGGLDLSPLIAILLIQLLIYTLRYSLLAVV